MPRTTKSYVKQSIEFRGRILHKCIELERWIESSIASHFYNLNDFNEGDEELAKLTDLYTLLIYRMTFDGKIAAYEQLLKKKYGSDFKRKCGKLMSELRCIKDERNIFAHYGVSLVEMKEMKPDNIWLASIKNNLDIIEYDETVINKWIERIVKSCDVIEKILNNEY